jgi:tRNA modification GTPase
MDGLRAALLTAAGWQPAGEDVILARGRHLQALEATLLHVDAAAGRIGFGLDDAAIEAAATNTAKALSSPELLAEDLRLAHLSLCSITGEFSADDLLGEIFSRFCIGK